MSSGYTLVEALAALLIVGLAIAGLTEGVATIGRLQSATARSIGEAVARRDAAGRFSAFMAAAGADLGGAPRNLQGGARQVSFDCGGRQACRAEVSSDRGGVTVRMSGAAGSSAAVRLPGLTDAHFVYVGDHTTLMAWPPAPPARDRLRSVSIVGSGRGAETPVATARLWLEQSHACEYDLISRACRGGGR